MEYKKQIPTYKVTEDVFNYILRVSLIEKHSIKDIGAYSYGYKDKNTVRLFGEEVLICSGITLMNAIEECNYEPVDLSLWKQYKVYMDDNSLNNIQEYNGLRAYSILKATIDKHYSKDEFEERILTVCNDMKDHKSQLHYSYKVEHNVIESFDNSYYYDINSAYCHYLSLVFPKCRSELEKLYNERKVKPKNKSLFTHGIGTLKHYYNIDNEKHYLLGRLWSYIVTETTKTLKDAIDYTDGILLYANTDGFIVQDPINKLNTSKELGAFKEEYAGTVYMYRHDGLGEGYSIIQYGKEVKSIGNFPSVLKGDVDLSVGKVVTFQTIYEEKLTADNQLIITNRVQKIKEVYYGKD